MTTITYKHQPAIGKTGGHVPLAGTKHLYTVSKVLWPKEIETFLATLFIGKTLHLCCGHSKLGDLRVDSDPLTQPDFLCEVEYIQDYFHDQSWDTVLCDPPYNGKFKWNHLLLSEIGRIARKRFIFQHWFIPANPDGTFKKWQDRWHLTSVYVWQPRTYFGRAQLISVFDTVKK